MARNLRILGLALAAVIAFALIAAASVLAAAFKCESENGRCILTGTTETSLGHEELFTANGSVVILDCHGEFSATQGEASAATLTVRPEYSECTSGEHVRTNHCALNLGVTTTNGEAPVSTECAVGSKIELDKTGVCTTTFGEQTGLTGGVHYVNTGNSTVTVEETIGNIAWTKANQTGNQFFCFGTPNGPGILTSRVTFHCYQDNGSELTGTERTTLTYSEGSAANCKYEA